MKLKDARENYYFFSGKTSEIVRQLAFAAIAVVWVFKLDNGHGVYKIPAALQLPVELIVAGLALDLLQYAFATLIWGIYQRRQELSQVAEDDEFVAPKEMNYLTIFLFGAKVVCIGAAYWYLLNYIWKLVL